jgi:hypothetical protein
MFKPLYSPDFSWFRHSGHMGGDFGGDHETGACQSYIFLFFDDSTLRFADVGVRNTSLLVKQQTQNDSWMDGWMHGTLLSA